MKKYLFALWCAFIFYHLPAQIVIDENIPALNIEHLIVRNFSGSIDVITHDQPTIEVKCTLKNDRYNKEIIWQQKKGENYLLFYLESPCTKSPAEINFLPDEPFELSIWQQDCDWDPQMEDPFPELHYTLKVPEEIKLYLTTVMDGDIHVMGFCDQVSANNVNGAIALDAVKNVIKAETVNGDVDITFVDQPQKSGAFSTINGDIKMHIVENPNLQLSFKSFMGDFFTNISTLEVLPDEVVRTVSEGTKYVIQEYTRMGIGTGGPNFEFETLNGDVYLKSKK